MNEANQSAKQYKLKGSVLFTVITVMSLLVIFMMGTLILAHSSSNRAHKSYSTSQVNLTARAAIESVVAALDKSEIFREKVLNLSPSSAPLELTMDLPPELSAMGRIRSIQVESVPNKKLVYNEAGNVWAEREFVKVTTEVELGGISEISTAYLVKNPKFGLIAEGATVTAPTGTTSIVTGTGEMYFLPEQKLPNVFAGGKVATPVSANCWGGTVINLGLVTNKTTGWAAIATTPETWNSKVDALALAYKNTWNTTKDYLSKSGPYQQNNDSVIEADFVCNGDLYSNTSLVISFPAFGTGCTVWGDWTIQNTDKMGVTSPYIENYVRNNGLNIDSRKLPYLYIDGTLKPNANTSLKLGNANLPMNIFCGTAELGQVDRLYADLYLMDVGKTSNIKLNGGTNGLYRWAENVITKDAYGVTQSVGGSIFSKGNLVLSANGSGLIQGSVRIEGNLTVNNNITINGDLVVGGNITGTDKLTVNGKIYYNGSGFDANAQAAPVLKPGVTIEQILVSPEEPASPDYAVTVVRDIRAKVVRNVNVVYNDYTGNIPFILAFDDDPANPLVDGMTIPESRVLMVEHNPITIEDVDSDTALIRNNWGGVITTFTKDSAYWIVETNVTGTPPKPAVYRQGYMLNGVEISAAEAYQASQSQLQPVAVFGPIYPADMEKDLILGLRDGQNRSLQIVKTMVDLLRSSDSYIYPFETAFSSVNDIPSSFNVSNNLASSVANITSSGYLNGGNGTTFNINPGTQTLWIVLRGDFNNNAKIIVDDSQGGTVNFFIAEDVTFKGTGAGIYTKAIYEHITGTRINPATGVKYDGVNFQDVGGIGVSDLNNIETLGKPNVYIYGKDNVNLTIDNLGMFCANIDAPNMNLKVQDATDVTPATCLIYYNGTLINGNSPYNQSVQGFKSGRIGIVGGVNVKSGTFGNDVQIITFSSRNASNDPTEVVVESPPGAPIVIPPKYGFSDDISKSDSLKPILKDGSTGAPINGGAAQDYLFTFEYFDQF